MQLPASDLYPEPLPIVRGTSGLLGRPSVRPDTTDFIEPIGYEEDGTPIFAEPPAPGPAIPAPCLRLLHSRNPETFGCPSDCAGRQRDGGCLCDIVREAEVAGEEWSFEIDKDMYWVRV
jgi:hypothetical protein